MIGRHAAPGVKNPEFIFALYDRGGIVQADVPTAELCQAGEFLVGCRGLGRCAGREGDGEQEAKEAMSKGKVGRVTPCAPQSPRSTPNGAHGVTRPTLNGAHGVTRPT